MIAYISALVLLSIALLFIAFQKTYYFFPARELKRQARGGDTDAGVLYRVVAYGASLRLLLWLAIGVSVASAYVLLTIAAPAWLVFAAVAGLVWYGFAWSPNARVGSIEAKLALLFSPAVSWILYYTHPLLDWIARLVERKRPVTFHTGLFERADLVDLIQSQKDMADSRIPDYELDMVLHSLSFGEKTVGSVMVPKSVVKTVGQDDVIGPILMDELYEDKHTRFPVVGNDPSVIVGTLYLRDLIQARQGGKVTDVMKKVVNYVHEDQTLYRVLHAFLTTKHSLFVVIDSGENYVGIITIEDVLEQVIGHKIEDDFDSYDDRAAVASSAKPADQPEPDPVTETGDAESIATDLASDTLTIPHDKQA